MLAQDSDMSQPTQYDPNTGVSYYPWESAEVGAVRSYNLTNMATMSNPFSQVMAPNMDARPEEVTESQSRDTQIQEESDREPTLADEDTPSKPASVSAHEFRAEGDSSMSWKGPALMGAMVVSILGAFYVVSTA